VSAADELFALARTLSLSDYWVQKQVEANGIDDTREELERRVAENERARQQRIAEREATTASAGAPPVVDRLAQYRPEVFAPTTETPATATVTPADQERPEAPTGIDDRRLKMPPRYRAVWRVLYRWAGSSHRVDRVVVSRLAAVARALEGEWGGFSTAVVRSAIEYLGHVSILDVRAMPAAKAQKGWRQRGEDGQFKETPMVVRVPLASELVLANVVVKTQAMPPAAKTGDPGHAARQRRYRQRQRA
jgi:hypothetical protein